MLLNCGVGEDSESPLDCKEIQLVHPKGDQSWVFIGRSDDEAETPIIWPPDAKNGLIGKKSWCWERLKAGGERDDRGWNGWMASPTQWTWIWANSGKGWRTRKPGVLQSMRSQRVGHNWETENNNNKVQMTWHRTGKSHSAEARRNHSVLGQLVTQQPIAVTQI